MITSPFLVPWSASVCMQGLKHQHGGSTDHRLHCVAELLSNFDDHHSVSRAMERQCLNAGAETPTRCHSASVT